MVISPDLTVNTNVFDIGIDGEDSIAMRPALSGALVNAKWPRPPTWSAEARKRLPATAGSGIYQLGRSQPATSL